MVLTTGWPVRLIPAWAGKTSATWFLRLRSPAHPRMGGENASELIDGLTPIGSSPRGRGKRRCSGNDHSLPVAHPRAGGENAPETSDKDVVTGSSPRGRGKLHVEVMGVALDGLIPARAGKTAGRASSRS